MKKETVNVTHKILHMIPLFSRLFSQVLCIDENNKPSTYETEIYALALVESTAKYSQTTPTDVYNEILPVVSQGEGILDVETECVGDFYHVNELDYAKRKFVEIKRRLEKNSVQQMDAVKKQGPGGAK